MKITEKAQEAFAAWKAWAEREGGAYWSHGNLADEDKQAWIRGYYMGVEHRLAGLHDGDSSDERLWNFGEDLEYFRSTTVPSEKMGKCHAAGYMAGYRLKKEGFGG